MLVKIVPGNLKGEIMAPASKSSMQRACAAALVARGMTIIRNPGHSNDDMAALDIVRRLGGLIYQGDEHMEIRSKGVKPTDSWVNCGESGLSIRMFTPLVALAETEITVSGTGSLVSRPMDFFDAILPELGVRIQSNEGKLPLRVCGPLKPADITIDGSLSSQFLTGLLLAFAASDAKGVSINVTNLKSKPYIDLTLDVMKKFGLKVPENRNYKSFYFSEESHVVNNTDQREYTVEGDWSGAAFLLVAGAIAGPITVKGLDLQSPQADKAILQALTACGAGISIRSDEIELRVMPMKAFHFDATECPDLFPPLVALASYCEGKTVIEGTSRLTHKESNRALTLQQEFGKLGVQIDLQDDLMIVNGRMGLDSGKVHSRHDHRIAMACAVAALRANGTVEIEEAEAINKSYPDFYEHLKSLGATIS
jgi:3-phosphoshikimate 1-carboxyvinyltransferase